MCEKKGGWIPPPPGPFRVKMKWFTGLLELVQLYKQDPLENIFIFTIYQNYTLALSSINLLTYLPMGFLALSLSWICRMAWDREESAFTPDTPTTRTLLPPSTTCRYGGEGGGGENYTLLEPGVFTGSSSNINSQHEKCRHSYSMHNNIKINQNATTGTGYLPCTWKSIEVIAEVASVWNMG